MDDEFAMFMLVILIIGGVSIVIAIIGAFASKGKTSPRKAGEFQDTFGGDIDWNQH